MSPNYKGTKVNALGLPIFPKNKSGRIKQVGRKRNFYGASFVSPFFEDSVKNLIILYDIPEDKKKERDWFRRHLIKFRYEMIQRSVWVGPSPLPKEFTDYLKEIKIGDHFKTFKLAKPYSEKNKAL
ncbi:MAG: CRISPR-associated endonuclease Cas2 [Candidatus Paceibacterota bacterium]|jgi:DNA-binding transcriptional regulator PaaX